VVACWGEGEKRAVVARGRGTERRTTTAVERAAESLREREDRQMVRLTLVCWAVPGVFSFFFLVLFLSSTRQKWA
jgi:hypothetical protein